MNPPPEPSEPAEARSPEQEARSPEQIAHDGAVFGYAGVTMVRTRASLVCLAGANNLVHQPNLATARARRVVSPNVDTLYSLAWLDLRVGPFVLTIPEITDRYFGFQYLDIYSNTFANIGTGATDGQAGRWAVVPPGWIGDLVGQATGEVTVIESPTWDVWLLGRALVRGPSDVTAANAVRHSYRLAPADPVSGAGVDPELVPPPLPAPACDNPPDPQQPTDGGAAYFDELAALLLSNPPPAADQPMVDTLASIGVTPGSRPGQGPDAAEVAMLAEAATSAEATVSRSAAEVAEAAGTWTASYGFGEYGTDYLTRAAVAAGLLAANVQEEVIYYQARDDSAGNPLTGTASYRFRFPADELPPVGPGGFWSVTMYGEDNFLVDNPAGVYALGDRTEGLSFGADGSLDVYVSTTPPTSAGTDSDSGTSTGTGTNWLPAPSSGGFNLYLRVYLPTDAATGRSWTPPPVERIEG